VDAEEALRAFMGRKAESAHLAAAYAHYNGIIR